MARFGVSCGAPCAAAIWILCALEARAGEAWVSAGAGGGAEAFHSYGGITWAPVGSLDTEGLRARAWGKALKLDQRGEVGGTGAEVELGWQFIGPAWRFAAFAGAAWRDEPGTNKQLGASLVAEGSYEITSRWRFIADGKYTIGLDEAWAQVRPEFKLTEALYVGVSAAGNKGPNYKLFQSAVSLGGFSYAMPWMGDVYVSVEAGAQYNVTTKNIAPFGALHLGFAY
ncbi:MAG: cellulose biosynthesis protein BcsS [Pseudomonadota bacterium]